MVSFYHNENMPLTIIALGSNIGDRARNFHIAIRYINRYIGQIIYQAPCYESMPMYYLKQRDFLNTVVVVNSRLKVFPLLKRLKYIEKHMGRIKVIDNAPRLIDLDIIYYAGKVIKTNGLKIPHQKMRERSFVMYPLYDAQQAGFNCFNISKSELYKLSKQGISKL